MEEVKFYTDNNILLINIKGELTILNATKIKDLIKNELEKSNLKSVIFDLTHVPLIDSSGMGVLISIYKKINGMAGKIVFTGVTDYVYKILGYAKLDKIFIFKKNIPEAIDYLNA